MDFNPVLDLYHGMAQYLSKKLDIRAADILDTWCVPELIVSYGTLANEEARENYERYKELDARQRQKYPRPQEYAVYFMGEI